MFLFCNFFLVNFKLALKLVAFELGACFGTVGKLVLYSFLKHSGPFKSSGQELWARDGG